MWDCARGRYCPYSPRWVREPRRRRPRAVVRTRKTAAAAGAPRGPESPHEKPRRTSPYRLQERSCQHAATKQKEFFYLKKTKRKGQIPFLNVRRKLSLLELSGHKSVSSSSESPVAVTNCRASMWRSGCRFTFTPLSNDESRDASKIKIFAL